MFSVFAVLHLEVRREKYILMPTVQEKLVCWQTQNKHIIDICKGKSSSKLLKNAHEMPQSTQNTHYDQGPHCVSRRLGLFKTLFEEDRAQLFHSVLFPLRDVEASLHLSILRLQMSTWRREKRGRRRDENPGSLSLCCSTAPATPLLISFHLSQPWTPF